MTDSHFARNRGTYEVLSRKHAAIVGLGSGGSALADMLARAGIGELTLIDPDVFSPENVGRHVLAADSIGKPKAAEMAAHVSRINPACTVTALAERFGGLPKRPDLVLSCADSNVCESLVNAYALGEKVPAIFGGAWHQASVGEIYYVVPGRTACLECYSGFRHGAEHEPDQARYWDPSYDKNRTPGQEGLWGNILLIAAVQFQVVLGLLGLRDNIDHEHNLWLVNVSDYEGDLQPLAVSFARVKRGCVVCDPALGASLLDSAKQEIETALSESASPTP